MTESTRGQVSATAAEIYEELFVPAMFQEWAPRLVDAAGLAPGHRVLDVACGTGVLARAAAGRVGPGLVTGLDINPGMLAVARRQAPEIRWQEGPAEALPFETGAFDAVVSQFGLMFFVDRPAAIREMRRVLRPGGRLAVAVWAALEDSPGYLALVKILDRLFGPETARQLRAPFVLGDPRALPPLFAEAGLPDVRVATVPGTARFPSLETWVFTEVKGWTAAEMIDDTGYDRLRRAAEKELRPFVAGDGTVVLSLPAHVVTVAPGA